MEFVMSLASSAFGVGSGALACGAEDAQAMKRMVKGTTRFTKPP
jgi:hypothetical protein